MKRTLNPKLETLNSLAVADFPSAPLRTGFNAPSVDEVDLSGYTGAVGDQIVIRASDDFDPSSVLRAGVVGVSPSIALRTGLTDAGGNAMR